MGASGRDDAERRALVAVAVGVRAAIVRAAAAGRRIDDGGPLTSFAGFPRHCCGETAELLREVLGALGWPEARVVDGVVDDGGRRVPHAWVGVRGWHVDAAPDAAGRTGPVRVERRP